MQLQSPFSFAIVLSDYMLRQNDVSIPVISPPNAYGFAFYL